MHIGFFSTSSISAARGGAEVMARDLAIALRGRGHTVDEFQLRSLPLSRRGPRAFRLLRHALRPLAPVFRQPAPKELDIVHLHSIGDSLGSELRSLSTSHRTIWTAHDFAVLCPKTTLLRSTGVFCQKSPLPCRVWSSLGSTFTRTLGGIVWPSEYVRGEYQSRLNDLPDYQVTIPNVPPQEVLGQAVGRQAVGNGEVLITHLGQLSNHKGTQLVVEAAQKLLSAGWRGRFLFGGDGPLRKDVVALVTRFPRSATYLGWVTRPDIGQVLLRSDAVLVPSIWPENAPMVVQEGAALGSAIIAARSGGLPEALSRLPNGFGTLTDPGSLEGLLTAITRVSKKHQEQVDLGQEWALKARAAYLESYEQVYSDIFR